MSTYSYSGNKKHKKKQNHASEYLPYLINELADEIEVVEQVLSRGEEGQVLTADSSGKAKWAVGGGGGSALYDDVEITSAPNEENGTNITTVTFLLNGNQITSPVWLGWINSNEDGYYYFGVSSEDGVVMIESGQAGDPDYELHILLPTGEVETIYLTNQSSGSPG